MKKISRNAPKQAQLCPDPERSPKAEPPILDANSLIVPWRKLQNSKVDPLFGMDGVPKSGEPQEYSRTIRRAYLPGS